MEVNINNTSQNNNSSLTYNYGGYEPVEFTMKVVTIIIMCIGLPLTLVAICAVRSLVKDDHVVLIYVINLLITDLIQLCCMIAWVLPKDWILSGGFILLPIYGYCLVASIGFMVCIALERYLVIACPLWYHFRRTIKVSVLVCVVVWALPAVIYCLVIATRNSATIGGILFLLPLPLFIFFLGGTLKALSASISVHSDEKRRIVGMLVLVLLIYTLLFLPTIILLLAQGSSVIDRYKLNNLSFTFVQLSPLAHLFLYIFMRKGTIDKLLASVCCCRMDSDDISSPV
ncbi:G-protein coupled receptor 4-like isoform X1 [Epinephelus fuscoguttatus]|uniref:G-protein coupled receptor 4-like isoform X1 n=1 Tax=Epinephelus fuscoguttatus TaxID=293821 RepID=UPI0020D0E6A8|nr:G-protein coupled receptor 4-like isoform X1 [Epinephelus fuscoguttatus]XP_049456155.1 G-protein coupled receptor 4-like isoform X1 [Epinephelus fuscoguttatus]XP_049456156.1 G-protein coupled receptor 4-like isoform X1 [Epinephelus fuscoguttatus]XP_049456157.1 G-protein coupled receptor 4-like isoform X1 [Epinephelus fuscoguttatus]